MLESVAPRVTSSHCYSSSSLSQLLDSPTALRTKSSISLLLVHVRLFLVYILALDIDCSFSEVLDPLSVFGARFLRFQRTFSLVAQAHPAGWRCVRSVHLAH